jgi:hypothetical protein
MSLVVGVLGFKGSGKDTVGDYLVQQHGFQRDSFANPLKDAVAATFNWPRELLEGNTKESREWRETPDEWWEKKLNWKDHPGATFAPRFTPRGALQWFGTEVYRVAFHDSIWIYSLEDRLRNAENVVITDCRFPNEVKVIKDSGGLVIRVKRGPEPKWYSTAIDALEGSKTAAAEMKAHGIHISEWAWLTQGVDAIFENDGTIQDLWDKADCLIRRRS